MIIVYRRWGFVFLLAGAAIGLPLLAATHSLSLPLLAIAALWIRYGREGTDQKTGELLPANSVYFIPLWVWGSILLVPALPLAIFEVTMGRPLAKAAAAAQNRQMAALQPAGIPGPPAAPAPGPAVATDTSEPPPAWNPAPNGPTQPEAPPSTPAPPKAKTLAESRQQLAEQHAAAREAFRAAHPEPPPPGMPVTEARAVKPGQKLLGKRSTLWSSLRVIAIADPGTLVVHWVSYSTVWDERLRLDQVRIGGEKDLTRTFGVVEKDERELVSVRKPDRGAVFEAGMRFLCDTDGLWLPVEIVRKVSPESVHVHWISFDSRFDETVPITRLRLPVEAPPPPGHRGPLPGEGVTLLSDLEEGHPILFRSGLEWKPVQGVKVLGFDHVEIDDPVFPGHRRKVKRSELRIQTDE